MKTIKLCTIRLIILYLIVLSSSAESITTTINSEILENHLTNLSDDERGKSYTGSFILKPGESIFLDFSVTSLKYINQYSISDCRLLKNELRISAPNIGGINSLPCASSNYKLFDLLIENRSRQVETINVKLAYSRKCPILQ